MSKHNETVTITFTNKTVIRVVIFVAVAFLLIGFISRISTALKLVLISAFLALALNPIVSFVCKQLPNKSRVQATIVTYLCALLVFVGFVALVIPPLVSQSVDFVDQIPISVEDFRNNDSPIVEFIQTHNLTNAYTQSISDIKDNLGSVTNRAFSLATLIGSGLVSVITVLVMTFMMLIEGPRWLARYYTMISSKKLEKHKQMISSMYRMVTGYVIGQLVVATIASIFAFFALSVASTILHVNINPIAMTGIVGLLGLIPMIGNIMASVIVVISCLFVSLPLAIVMTIFFIIYQQVENATLQPYIQSRYNELTPLTVFVSAIIGVSIAGFLGALIAIPVAGCIRIYLKSTYGETLAPSLKE